MKRTLFAPFLLAAACGGSPKPAPAAPSNTASGSEPALAMEEDEVAADPQTDQQALDRQQAIEQARAAGVLGNTNAAPTPAPSGDPRDKLAIRAVVRGDIQKIQYCYEKQLLVTPGLHGTTTAHFVIEQDGTVSSSTAQGFDTNVDTCIASVMSGLRFAPAAPTVGAIQVNYPFVFREAPPAPAPAP